MPSPRTSSFVSALTQNRVYRSVIRHGFPDSNRNRSLAVFTNFFLHIHPVKVRRRAIAFRQTFYLGGLSAATFFILVVSLTALGVLALGIFWYFGVFDGTGAVRPPSAA